MQKKPETIENRWDILYRDYPEVYDKFASFPYYPKQDDILNKWFDLKQKVIVDVGSGSGKSTFRLAKYAKNVIGIEPEDAMMSLAIENAKKYKIRNGEFKKGTAGKMPLKSNSVDIVIAITGGNFYNASNIKKFVKEAKRVLVKRGFIISVDIAPKWYGGELAHVILGKSRTVRSEKGTYPEEVRHRTFISLGFKHKDFYQTQEYGSLRNILSTYGFIFGNKVIRHIKKHRKTTIKWKFRVYYKLIK